MNRNLESSTQLTEFAPLSPEPHQPAVGLFLSRIFKFSRGYRWFVGGSPPESAPAAEGDGGSEEGVAAPDASAPASAAPLPAAAPAATPLPAAAAHALPVALAAAEANGRGSIQHVLLRRIRSLLALNTSDLQEYKDSDLKKYWMQDNTSNECYECSKRFTTLRRRHHCRICGQIFCSRCCGQEIPGRILRCSGALRVCSYCYKLVDSELRVPNAALTGSPTGDGVAATGAQGAAAESGAAGDGSGGAARARRTSHQEDRFGARAAAPLVPAAAAASSVPQLSAEERARALRRSSSLRALHTQLTRSPCALPLRPSAQSAHSLLGLRAQRGPAAPPSFTGAELVDWLRARGHANSREQACALAQALLDGGFLESASPSASSSPSSSASPSPAASSASNASNASNAFEDGPAAYRPLPAPTHPPPSPPPNGSRPHGRAFSGDSAYSQDAWGTQDSLGTDSESECPAFEDNEDERECSGGGSGGGSGAGGGGGGASEGASGSGVSEDASPSEPERSLASSGSTFYLDLNVEAGAVALSRPRPPPSAAAPNAPRKEAAPPPPRPQPPDAPPAPAPTAAQDADERTARMRLEEAYDAHEALLLRQLLRAEGLSAQWEQVLLPLLAAAADAVRVPFRRPDAEAAPIPDMDVRRYVQFKKVSGGERSDCRLVRGVVCTKNVAHRHMPRRLENARVLCVGGAIAFQRVEGRLQSLEPLLLGEREYLSNVVARLVALEPSLVLVARGVARPAQELLLASGVALALNVKGSVMARVARCTGADVLESADSQLGPRRLGFARLFQLRTFRCELPARPAEPPAPELPAPAAPDFPADEPPAGEPPVKTLLFLEGCAQERLGATVLLRGGSDAELRRVKRVARLALLARYGGRLERAFLLAEGARPPSPPAAPRFAADDDDEDPGPEGTGPLLAQATPPPSPRAAGRAPRPPPRPATPMGDSPSEDEETRNLTNANETKKQVETRSKGENDKMRESLNADDVVNKNDGLQTQEDVQHQGNEQEKSDDVKDEPQKSVKTVQKKGSVKCLEGGNGGDADWNNEEEGTKDVETQDDEVETKGAAAAAGSRLSVPRPESPAAPAAPAAPAGAGESGAGGGEAAGAARPRAISGRQERSPGEERRGGGGGACAEAVSDFSDPLRRACCPADEQPLSGPRAPPPPPVLSVATLPRDNRFREALAGTLLSGSPYLQFPVPRLETEAGRACALWRYLPKDLFWSAQFHPAADGPSLAPPPPAQPPPARPPAPRLGEAHPFVRARLTSAAGTREVQTLLAHFRACGGRLPLPLPPPCPAVAAAAPSTAPGAAPGVSANAAADHEHSPQASEVPAAPPPAAPPSPPDALDPRNHQHLAVLFCSYALTHNAAPAYCLAPWVVHMDLYDSSSDVSLERFLERHCFRSDAAGRFECPADECEAPLLHHVRRFVHDGACLTLSLSHAPRQLAPDTQDTAPAGDDHDQGAPLLAWSWCQRCKAASPAQPLDVDARALSFAKFLELRFHTPAYRRRSAPACAHSLHRDHVLCLARAGVVASFRYSQVQQWEVALPPPEVALGAAAHQRAAVIEELKQLALRGFELFSAVLDRLAALHAHTDVSALKAAVAREQSAYKARIEEIQLRLTSPTLETRRMEAAAAATGAGGGFDPSASQAERDVQLLMWPIEDSLVCLKRSVADAVESWNARLLDAAAAAASARRRAANDAAAASAQAPGAASSLAGGGVLERPVSPALEAGACTPSPPSEGADDLPPLAEERVVPEAEGAPSPLLTSLGEAETSPAPAPAPAPAVFIVHNNDVPEATGSAFRPLSASEPELLPAATTSEAGDGARGGGGGGGAGGAGGRQLGVKSLLSQLLAGGGAGPPLQSPLAPAEHPLAGAGWALPVVVYEGEPSSVVAAALASPDYRRAVEELRRAATPAPPRQPEQLQPSPLHKRRSGGSCASASSPASACSGASAAADGSPGGPGAEAGAGPATPTTPTALGMAGGGAAAAARRAGVLSFLRGGGGGAVAGGGVGGAGATRVDGVAYRASGAAAPDQVPLTPKEGAGAGEGSAACAAAGGVAGAGGACGAGPNEEDGASGGCPSAGGGGGGGGAGGGAAQHVEVTLSEGGAVFFCRVYFALAFAALRERLLPGGEEAYARSLTRCVQWAARGGKSGSAFRKTKDDRFVLKEMSRMEMQLFLDFATHYFTHVHSSLAASRPMLLGKIVGVYRIKVRSASGSTMASNLLVMENLFFRRHVTHKFDLKGSMRNRLAETLPEQGGGNGELVLLDENLLKMTCDSPLYVYPHSKAVLMQAIHNDTQFLAAQDVMDYSLLVGLDEDRHELVVGIIDYIRTFTWDKKLEAMVKYYGQLGGGQARLPTVVSPELYRTRFVNAMHQYFLPVPDRWTHLGLGLMEGAT